MKYCKDENGKAYYEVSDEELPALKALGVQGFYLGQERKKLIPPPECKHEFVIEEGLPRNFKVCKHCIYWEFTMQIPENGEEDGGERPAKNQ